MAETEARPKVKLTKKQLSALEECPIYVTGKDLELNPRERMRQAGIISKPCPQVTIAYNFSREELDSMRTGVRTSYFERDRYVGKYDVMVVDGEVYLRPATYGLYASGWGGVQTNDFANTARDRLFAEKKFLPTVTEMQRVFEELDRKPPSANERLLEQLKRDSDELMYAHRLQDRVINHLAKTKEVKTEELQRKSEDLMDDFATVIHRVNEAVLALNNVVEAEAKLERERSDREVAEPRED